MTGVPVDLVALFVVSVLALGANVWFLRHALYPRG